MTLRELLDAAEKERDEAEQARREDHAEWHQMAERCATLEAALREIATLVPFRDGSDRGRDGLPTGAGTSPGRDLSSTPGRGLPRDDS